MTTEQESDDSPPPTPGEAFAILGDETRVEILQALGEADEPVAYSELFERIDYDDGSNFSYHLDKLTGHFVRKAAAGYSLRRPGERVVEAVLSGAVTTDPVREWTRTDHPCPFCSAPVEVGYREERLTLHCPECSGLLGTESDAGPFTDSGNLGFRPLPPAGIQDRPVEELFRVSEIWTATSMQAIARGVCPRCSGRIEHTVDVCEDHDAGEGPCESCGFRFGASYSGACSNCVFGVTTSIAGIVGVQPESMAFVADHGVDPVAPDGVVPYGAVEETIHSHDPFVAAYTITLEDEHLSVTVDEELAITDVTRGQVRRAD